MLQSTLLPLKVSHFYPCISRNLAHLLSKFTPSLFSQRAFCTQYCSGFSLPSQADVPLLFRNYPRQNLILDCDGPTSICFSPTHIDSGINSHLHHDGLIRSPQFPRSPNAGAYPPRASTLNGLDVCLSVKLCLQN